jgi:hypothetical protein
MRHIGIDIDTRHEAPGEPEPSSDCVVVDLVVGFLGRVEGLYAIRAKG